MPRAARSNPMAATTLMVQHATVPLEALSAHPRNYRRHPQQQLDRLAASLARFGQVRSIVVQQGAPGHYLIVAGHGLVEAAQERGMTELRADVIPATWTPEQVEGYLIADNQLAAGAQDDLAALAELLEAQYAADYDLESVGSSRDELDVLLAELAEEHARGSRREVDDPGGGGDDFDTTVDEQGETRCKVGDLWELGQHRLLCSDSTKAENVLRLMRGETAQMVWSDPPYGISIVATNGYVGGGEAYDIPFGGVKNRGDVGGTASHMRKTGKPYIADKRLGSADGAKPFGSAAVRGSDRASNIVEVGKYAPVIGDDTTETAVTSYTLLADLYPKAKHIWWGGNYYANVLPSSSGCLIWDKRSDGITVMPSNNFADCELAWVSNGSPARIFRHIWYGMIRSSEHGKRVHPTQKPVVLAGFAFNEYGAVGDVILDPFCGSGMSVVAAERLGRKVYALEMSPEYCDVILRRWEAETGREATLLERTAAAAETETVSA